MPSARSALGAATRWDIATPSGPSRLPGVRMAGFGDRGTDLAELDVVPYPAVTVAVDLGDELVVSDVDRAERGTTVLGVAPRGVRAVGRAIECLQVRMSPLVAHAVLDAASDLGGTVAGLDALWGREAGRIEDQLRSAPSWDERFTIAEEEIARRLAAGRAVDAEVAHAWSQMAVSGGQVRVEALAAELGWSRRRLWSRFRSQVGLTPKRAAQLIRFDLAVHRLAAGHPAAQVAAEAGYADQSHLHREVKAFTGLSPTAAAVAPWLAVDDVAWAAPGPPPGT